MTAATPHRTAEIHHSPPDEAEDHAPGSMNTSGATRAVVSRRSVR